MTNEDLHSSTAEQNKPLCFQRKKLLQVGCVGSAGLIVGLSDLTGLFQPQRSCESVIVTLQPRSEKLLGLSPDSHFSEKRTG